VILAAYALKGLALWRAGRNDQRGWFVALLLVNTLGILELIYLMTAGKKRR
jgi:methionyl-tRNA synthetase